MKANLTMDYLYNLFGPGDGAAGEDNSDTDAGQILLEVPEAKRPRLVVAQQQQVPSMNPNGFFNNNINNNAVVNNNNNNNNFQFASVVCQLQQQQQQPNAVCPAPAVNFPIMNTGVQQQQQQQQQQQPMNNTFSVPVVTVAPAVAAAAPPASHQSLLVQSVPWAPPSAAPGTMPPQQQPQQQQTSSSQPTPLPILSSAMPVVTSSAASAADLIREEKERIEQKKRKNAEQARKSREKKRNKEVVLRLELRELQRENDHLKSIVKNEISDKAQQIIGECCYKQHENSLFQSNHNDQASRMNNTDFELIEGLTKGRQAFVMTDPRLPDNPIVYASAAFLDLTGYTKNDVVGRNCRFLQGVDTDPAAVSTIRQAIEKGQDGAACLLNYKADGTPFWNHLFVAALHDGENRIVNYVGVQTGVDKPIHEEDEEHLKPQKINKKTLSKNSSGSKNSKHPFPDAVASAITSAAAKRPPPEPEVAVSNDINKEVKNKSENNYNQKDDVDIIDWAELAGVLEADYQARALQLNFDEDEDGTTAASTTAASEGSLSWLGSDAFEREMESAMSDASDPYASAPNNEKLYLGYFSDPRGYITRTVRSELIDSLLCSEGDVEDPRFLSALDVLSSVFKTTAGSANYSLSPTLNGSWRSISLPLYHYGGCLGMNEKGDFVYTLGKMCFSMFKPTNVRCTVKNTMNHIQPVCSMDHNPSAAPWSLRRELALVRDDDPDSRPHPNTMLKSYDIVIALTIEPGQFKAGKNEKIPSPPCRLHATHVIRGYFLPDPDTPNRMTVWFTGGELAIAPMPPGEAASGATGEDRYGGLQEWIDLFGAEHKRTWGESLTLVGAKLFLGAELPDGMDPNGTMKYMLHRPYGGHGKGYVDVMYADPELLITKGNSGTLHVMVQKPQDS